MKANLTYYAAYIFPLNVVEVMLTFPAKKKKESCLSNIIGDEKYPSALSHLSCLSLQVWQMAENIYEDDFTAADKAA